MKFGYTHKLIVFGCVIGIGLLWGGCAKEKIAAPDDYGLVAVSFPFKSQAPAALTFEMIVEGRDFGTKTFPMVQTIDSVFGRADSIPVGRDRKVIVRALDPMQFDPLQQPAVIYRGLAVVDISPGRAVNVNILLRPTEPTLTITPRNQSLLMGDTIYADVNVFNIPDLSGITFDLYMTPGPAYIASAVKGDQYGDLVSATFTSVIDTQATVTVAHRNEIESIVDASGNAHLATIIIFSHQNVGNDVTMVTMRLRAVFRSGYGTGGGLPIEIVYRDEAIVELTRPPLRSGEEP